MTRAATHRRYADLLEAKKSITQWIEGLLDGTAEGRAREEAFASAVNSLADELAQGNAAKKKSLHQKIQKHFAHLSGA
jgi:hypothetical protein